MGKSKRGRRRLSAKESLFLLVMKAEKAEKLNRNCSLKGEAKNV